MHPYTTAVIVPGHGVCMKPWDPYAEAAWVGIYPGEAAMLVEHVAAGIEKAAQLGGILLTSGADTRPVPVSEASSMREIAAQHDFFGHPIIAARTVVEEHARDSLGNAVLSLGAFRNLCGVYPRRIVVCGYGFKAERFCRHAEAIGWRGDFDYVAVNQPRPDIIAAARAGERLKLEATRDDPFLLQLCWREQRALRNPRNRALPRFEDVGARAVCVLHSGRWSGRPGAVLEDLTSRDNRRRCLQEDQGEGNAEILLLVGTARAASHDHPRQRPGRARDLIAHAARRLGDGVAGIRAAALAAI